MITVEKSKKCILSEIAKRAAARKANPNLRHIPNKNDLQVASEHTKLMIYHQYQAITPEGRFCEHGQEHYDFCSTK